MIESLGYGPNIVGLGTNADLRRYARWEYGAPDAGWLLSGVRRPHRRIRADTGLGRRLWYWLNSFRGFAAFDLRGTDGRA
jgi:hypothetical protein